MTAGKFGAEIKIHMLQLDIRQRWRGNFAIEIISAFID